MSKLTKVSHKVFGILANFTYQMSKFGSFKNGSPEYAANVTEIQSTPNFENGLYDSLVGDGAPFAQDMNGVLHHTSRQVGYLYQEGIPEWDADSTYYINSLVKYNGEIFKSLIDNNTGNAPTPIFYGNANWFCLVGDFTTECNTMTTGLQVMASGENPLDLPDEVYDPKDLVNHISGYEIWIPHTGYYNLSGLFQTDTTPSGILTIQFRLYVNGGFVENLVTFDSTDTLYLFKNFFKSIRLQKDDRVKIKVANPTGGAILAGGSLVVSRV